MSTPVGLCGVTRRGFLLGAAAGLGAGVPLTWYGRRAWESLGGGGFRSPYFGGPTTEVERPREAMPGPYPGRVIEVRHANSVDADHRIDRPAVAAMVDRGMRELTGADHGVEAWRRLFEPGDVVGIKVNPVGRRPLATEARSGSRHANAVGSISNPEVLLEVVAGLKAAGVRPRDIVLFERYAEEFVQAGYEELTRERALDGVRWAASAVRYTGTQTDIAGFDQGRDACSPELARQVVGYDPEVFVHMGFASPEHDPTDDRRFRSHLSMIVSRMVNKVVTLPVLKDHRSAGVTLALKNLSHGMNSNVARSHLGTVTRRSGRMEGPNQCNTFIPTAVSHRPLREKATLHLLDGLIGVYEGGPGSWNKTWGTWRHRGLFFATDPVALDHVGWDILDAKRAEEGWAPVGHMGLLQRSTAGTLSTRLAALAAANGGEALALTAAGLNRELGRATENFDRRQPEHVILAGEQGLGVFDARRIEHRVVVL